MKKFLLILISLPLINYGQLTSEQVSTIDSLKEIIEKPDHDTTLIKAWIAWDDIIYISDPELDLNLNYKIDSLCDINLKKKITPQEAHFYHYSQGFAANNIGIIYYYRGILDQALIFNEKGLKARINAGDRHGVATSLNNAGNIYDAMGDYQMGIDFYMRSMKMYEKLQSKEGMAMTYNNIGKMHRIQDDDSTALEYYLKSLSMYQELGFKDKIAPLMNNVGSVYKEQNDFDLAMKYYLESAEISLEIGNKRELARVYGGIASIYEHKGELDMAIEYNNKSKVLYEEIQDYRGLSVILNMLGNNYMSLGNYQKSKEFCEKSLEFARSHGGPMEIKSTALSLWKIYKVIGNYKKSLEMYEYYVQIKDTILSEENQKFLIRQEYQHEYEKKAAADSVAFEKEKEIATIRIEKTEAELDVKRNQQYALFGGTFLIAVFAGFIYNRFKLTKKQKMIIEETHSELEEKNQEILDSINYAKRIQTAILPPEKLVNNYLDNSFILYKPKDIVAGDFYWLEKQNERVFFAAADCTGHGVPGAMVSVICNNGLNRSVREFGLKDPGKILDKTRELVISEFEKSEEAVKDGMDIALCSLEGNHLYFAGAHNPLWIIRKDSTEIQEIKADKQPIGQFAEPVPFTSHCIEFNEGDTLYIFSDGFADQFGGEKGKKFKAKNFKNLLVSIQNESMTRQKELIDEAFEKWKGNLEQLDDVCVIGVRV